MTEWTSRDRWITDAVLKFDGGNEIPITLGDASRTAANDASRDASRKG